MIGVVCISKQDKLIGKRKHTCLLVQKKNRTEEWWLKMIGAEASASGGKKTSYVKRQFHEIICENTSCDIS